MAEKESIKQIECVVREMQIRQAGHNLINGPQSDLDLLLSWAGYKKATLQGIPYDGGGQLYVGKEELKQILDESQIIPPYKPKQEICQLELIVCSKYSAQVAVLENDDIRLFDINAKGSIQRQFNKNIPPEKQDEFNLKSIIQNEGYRILTKADPNLIPPAGCRIVGVRKLEINLNGNFSQLRDNPYQLDSQHFEVGAKGDLKVTCEMLILRKKDFLYVEINLSKYVDVRYKVNRDDARAVENHKQPLEMPQFGSKFDIINANTVTRKYIAKRDNLYYQWIQDEIQKLPIDESVRKQLGLDLNKAQVQYSEIEAKEQLVTRALEVNSQK